jgi:hypothetical protein
MARALILARNVLLSDSLGILHMQLPTPNGSFIMLEVYVVPTNVPMLLGLDVLDKFGLCADTVHNVLHCTVEDWNLSLVRKLGHVYLEWSATDRILYTKPELQNCIAIFRTHRRKTSSHCSSVQKLTTWMPTRE